METSPSEDMLNLHYMRYRLQSLCGFLACSDDYPRWMFAVVNIMEPMSMLMSD